MRKLAIFSCAFAAATAAYVWLIPSTAALICAAAFAALFAILFVWRSDMSKRLRIASVAIAIGLVWSWGYEVINISPLREYCADRAVITVEVSGYPEKTTYGSRVETVIDGGTMLLFLNETYELKPGDLLCLDAEIIDVSRGCFVAELTGDPSLIDDFLDAVKPFEMIEMCRTGATALERGKVSYDID